MKIIRGNCHLTHVLKGSVVTLGNFDGMHLGHQALLRQLIGVGRKLQLPTVLITFEPQPKEFFQQQPVSRLMRFREKCLAAENYGIDFVLCLRFNQTLADLSAEDFVKNILVDQLGMAAIVVGDDFRFGAKRAGDFALLKELGEQYNFQVVGVHTVDVEGKRVSSTRVREALRAGNMNVAEKLLGHSYYLFGKVLHGDKVGRDLGFPTANINLHRKLVPIAGIFVIRAHIFGDGIYNGVANVGTRPVFNGTRVLLEVYLFNFNADIYGHNMQVEFLHKLRDEERYDSVEKLIKQIHQDVIDAERYFFNYT